MKLYKLSRGSIAETALAEIGEVEAKEMGGGRYQTRASTRIKGLDKPSIQIKITVFSKKRDTCKLDRLCAKIRKALEEYNGRG